MAKKPAKKMAKKPAKKMAAPKKAAKKPAPAKKMAPAKPGMPSPEKIKTSIRPKNTGTNSYTFSEFVDNIKGFCGLMKRSEAKLLVEDIATFVKDSLRRGYKIPLFGLGKMYVRQSKARTARNPQTGELIPVPAKKRVRFTAAKALKEAVL